MQIHNANNLKRMSVSGCVLWDKTKSLDSELQNYKHLTNGKLQLKIPLKNELIHQKILMKH